MQRFKAGDAVFILPKFAHLYTSDSAVVARVKEDPFRGMFNEYIVEFADGSNARIFEYQIIEDVRDYKVLIASLVFDSRQHMAQTQARGWPSGAQIILQTPGFDIDIKIRLTKPSASIMGQVLERGTTNLLKHVPVQLMREGMTISAATSDNLGVFKFSDVPDGSLNILAVIAQQSLRLFGTFSI